MAGSGRALAAACVTGAMALLAAGCGSGGATHATATTVAPASPPLVSTVHWVPCSGNAGPKGYQCATVPVPRNPSHPDGQMIGMAIDRHAATGKKIGSLLVNPGGPGVSGVDALPGFVGVMPKSVLSRFDVVGFDPPGVERTAPINCLQGNAFYAYLHVDPAPPTAAGFAGLVASNREFAAACKAQSGAELPYVSTVDAARDMDVLRQALGDPQLNYLGFSYGTKLGAVYAGLFPTRIRAMVLDGALDPALAPIPYLDEQAASLDAQLQTFFSQCSAGNWCAWRPSGGDSAAFDALLARVRAAPIPVRGTGQTVGPSELMYGTAQALYSPGLWQTLGQALQAISNGDASGILNLFNQYTERQPNGTYSNTLEAINAVDCLDAPAPTIAQIQAAVPQARSAAPVFGVANLYGEVQCAVWPVPATGRVGPIRAVGAPPIVVVGSTGDPITPYQWAQNLASELGSGRLLTRVGDGHTAYPFSSCIRSKVDSYLVNLTLPAVGTRCSSD